MPKQTSKSASEAPSILLDTHIAIWLSDGSTRLKPSVLSLIESSFHSGKLCISAISAWEIGLLVSKNRLNVGQSAMAWFDSFVRQFNIYVLDISAEIAINSSYLPGKFHGDPADRILVATALAHSTALVSADKEIVSYGKQGFVQIIACG
jgi:PIN domain nuclease of toxin-antitoxin system